MTIYHNLEIKKGFTMNVSNQKEPLALVILDGLGYREEKELNAVHHANTPNLDKMINEYPNTLIKASGTSVGLPDGYMGTSEVGHMTIGAGRIIKQSITKINESIKDGSFFSNKKLNDFLKNIENKNSNLHLLGMTSDAGVHSHISHLFAILKTAKNFSIKNIFIHAFLDGRDVPPYSAKNFLSDLDKELKNYPNTHIADIHGRFYAMDRDKNWERIKESYDTLTIKKIEKPKSWETEIQKFYDEKISDEFITPTQLHPNATIKSGDGIIYFNSRPDRARQLAATFVEKNFDGFERKSIPETTFLSMIRYSEKFSQPYIFEKEKIEDTLLNKLSNAKKTIFTIAETEKYAHITYFFSGGKETTRQNETRVLIPSIKAKNYIENPQMSAAKITDAIVESLENKPCDFYLVNYANPDMVGHSGNFEATVKAVECVDKQIGKLYEEIVEKRNGTLLITADHGNAEIMFDKKSDQPHTQHTTNLVRFLFVTKTNKRENIKLSLNGLYDIAPFILKNMNID